MTYCRKLTMALIAISPYAICAPAVAQTAPYNLELRTQAINTCADKLSAGEIQPTEMNQCINTTYSQLLNAANDKPNPGSIMPPDGVNCHMPSRITPCPN